MLNEKFLYKNVLIKSETLSKDLEPRSLIFVLAENHTEFFTSYIGFFRKELVQMLLDPKISIDLLKELIETYMPNYIFLPNSLRNDLKSYEVLTELDDHVILKLNKGNFVILDGERIYATRHAIDHDAPSLYLGQDEKHFPGGWLIASEPLSTSGEWLSVPKHHLVVLSLGSPPEQIAL